MQQQLNGMHKNKKYLVFMGRKRWNVGQSKKGVLKTSKDISLPSSSLVKPQGSDNVKNNWNAFLTIALWWEIKRVLETNRDACK